MRIYVGEIGNNYQVRAYLGGRLDPSGALRDPEGERTAFIEENSRVTNQWVEIELPAAVLADNIEVWTLGPTVFYEIEIYRRAADHSVVRALPWAQLKAQPKVE